MSNSAPAAPPQAARPCRRCKRRPALERLPWCGPCRDDLKAAGFSRAGRLF